MSAAERALDVVLVTEDRYERPAPDSAFIQQMLHEEELVADALRRLGLRVDRVAWSNPSFDWSSTSCALFRSTWDYFRRFDEFTAWLARAERATRLLNPAPLVRWNADKRYLLELARRGVPVVRTELLPAGSALDLERRLAELGWDEAVCKPAISASGHETHRVVHGRAASLEPRVAELLRRQSLLLQPFRREILDDGELSLIVIDGRFTHAVRKIPARGDFRVQDDHGGTVAPDAATAQEIAFAETAAAAAPSPPSVPVYARVDCVRTSDGPLLMELELIEPELFFRFFPEAAARLAARVVRELHRDRARP